MTLPTNKKRKVSCDSDDKLEQIRSQLCQGGSNVCHFNNAGDSPMPSVVLDLFKKILDREQEIGGYATADEYKSNLENTRSLAGRLVNAVDAASEIALVDSATTAWMRAFYSIKLDKGNIIVTCEAEYAANYVAMLQQCKRFGAEIQVVPSRADNGTVDLKALEKICAEADGRVKAVCITHIPTNGGLVNPAAEIGAIANRYKAIYLLDACQSVGQLPIDVQAIGCDLLSATGRKFLRGPRGTGFLYVKAALLTEVATPNGRMAEPPTIDHFAAPWTDTMTYELAPTARRYEQWESNYAGLCALGTALQYALDVGVEEYIWPRVQKLGTELRRRLVAASSRIAVHDLGTEGTSQCGIVTFSVEGLDASEIKQELHKKLIFVNISMWPFSTRLDASRRKLPEAMIRASIHYFNTEEEIDRLVGVVKGMM